MSFCVELAREDETGVVPVSPVSPAQGKSLHPPDTMNTDLPVSRLLLLGISYVHGHLQGHPARLGEAGTHQEPS